MNIFDDISINAGWKAADNHSMSKADFKFALAAIEASLRERGLTQGLLDKPLIEGGERNAVLVKQLAVCSKRRGMPLEAAHLMAEAAAALSPALVKEGVVELLIEVEKTLCRHIPEAHGVHPNPEFEIVEKVRAALPAPASVQEQKT